MGCGCGRKTKSAKYKAVKKLVKDVKKREKTTEQYLDQLKKIQNERNN